MAAKKKANTSTKTRPENEAQDVKQLPETAATAEVQETALTIVPRKAEIVHQRFDFTQQQMTLIKDQYAKGTTNDEFAVFIHVCKARKLDPLQKQIYCIMRADGEDAPKKMTIQVGIDGFRSIANRTREYAPSDKATEYSYSGTELKSARVYVKKFVQGTWHEFSAEALLKEYKPNGKMAFMWNTKPHVLLEKCAEAKALRRGWPEELGGFYVEEEMHSADNVPVNSKNANVEEKKSQTTREVGTLKQSATDNRGHGDENLRGETKSADQVAKEVAGVSKGVPAKKAAIATRPMNILRTSAKSKKDEKDGNKEKRWVVLYVAPVEEPKKEMRLWCWHESLFNALLHEPPYKNCVFTIVDGTYPSIEDVLSINGTIFKDGKPVLAEQEYIEDESGLGHEDTTEHGVGGVFER